MEPTVISLMPDAIDNSTTGKLLLKSHRLSKLANDDLDLTIKLIEENGFKINPQDLSVDTNGIVTLRDKALSDAISNKINKKDLVAFNICGLCKVT